MHHHPSFRFFTPSYEITYFDTAPSKAVRNWVEFIIVINLKASLRLVEEETTEDHERDNGRGSKREGNGYSWAHA
jgi:hypothetical protein